MRKEELIKKELMTPDPSGFGRWICSNCHIYLDYHPSIVIKYANEYYYFCSEECMREKGIQMDVYLEAYRIPY